MSKSAPHALTNDAPHLLTLPREIRDQIYSYLYREVAFKERELKAGCIAQLRVENMPYPALSQVNSQLHHEYGEKDHSRQGVTAHLIIRSRSHSNDPPSPIPTDEAAAMPHIHHLTISTSRLSLSMLNFFHFFLQHNMPHLHTIRLLTWRIRRPLTEVPATSQNPSYNWNGIVRVPIAEAVCGLRLVQKVNCRYVQYEEMPGHTNYPRFIVGCTYAADTSDRLLWIPQHVLDVSHAHQYPRPVLDASAGISGVRLVDIPPVVHDWQEQRFDVLH